GSRGERSYVSEQALRSSLRQSDRATEVKHAALCSTHQDGKAAGRPSGIICSMGGQREGAACSPRCVGRCSVPAAVDVDVGAAAVLPAARAVGAALADALIPTGLPDVAAVLPLPVALDPHVAAARRASLCAGGRRRGRGTHGDGAPVPLYPDVVVAVAIPAARDPLLLRADALIAAVDPDPVAAAPIPAAVDPDVAGAGTRADDARGGRRVPGM